MSGDIAREAERLALRIRTAKPDGKGDRRLVAGFLAALAEHSTPAAGFELRMTARELWAIK